MTILPHQSSLSREERERIKRELVLKCAADLKASNEDIAQVTADVINTLLAELEQAERERDECMTAMKSVSVENLMDALDSADRRATNAEARLAKVPALVEALQHIVDAEAGQLADVASAGLAVWEAE